MSSRNSICDTVPICTPTRRTGDPSVRPLVLSSRVQYLDLRANSLCSLLIAMTPTANRMRPMDTKAPTLISLVALESRMLTLPSPGQEVAQPGLLGGAGFVHGSDEVHPPFEQVRDAIPDEKGTLDVVRDHHRRDMDLSLQPADQGVDRVRRHRIQP